MGTFLFITGAILFFTFIYLAFNFSVLFNLPKRYFFTLFAAADAWMIISYKQFWPVMAVVFMGGVVAFYYVFYRLEAAQQAKEIQANE